MSIDKETFCKLMNSLKRQADKDQSIASSLTGMSDTDVMGTRVVFTTELVQDVVEALNDILEQPDNDDKISYFAWELDFGRSPDAINCVALDDGSPASLTSPEELYDYISEDKNRLTKKLTRHPAT